MSQQTAFTQFLEQLKNQVQPAITWNYDAGMFLNDSEIKDGYLRCSPTIFACLKIGDLTVHTARYYYADVHHADEKVTGITFHTPDKAAWGLFVDDQTPENHKALAEIVAHIEATDSELLKPDLSKMTDEDRDHLNSCLFDILNEF